jgi:hypothetical protein
MCQKLLKSVGEGWPHNWVKYNLKNFFNNTLPYLTYLTCFFFVSPLAYADRTA